VFGGVVLDELWGLVGGVVVDDKNGDSAGVGQKGVESGFDSLRVVVNGYYDSGFTVSHSGNWIM